MDWRCFFRVSVSLFSIATDRNCSVKSQYREIYDIRVWNVRFNGMFNESCFEEHEELMLLINNYEWKDSDKILWRWNNSWNFSVKSFYNFLNDGGLVCPDSKFIWQNLAPLKVRILLWLVLNNCLLTSSILKKRHLYIDRKCVFCEEEEDLEHIFIKCLSLKFFWVFFLRFFNISFSPSCIRD